MGHTGSLCTPEPTYLPGKRSASGPHPPGLKTVRNRHFALGAQIIELALPNHRHRLDSQHLKGAASLIPELDASTGHLPLGRYHVTLDEVRSRFVAHPDFEGFPTREAIWQGSPAT